MADGSMSVSIHSDETGPIGGTSAQLNFEPGQSKEVLDDVAAATFQEVMLSVFVPDDVQPAPDELVAMVAANWPTELGSGWLFGFDRSSQDRRFRIVYSEADAQDD